MRMGPCYVALMGFVVSLYPCMLQQPANAQDKPRRTCSVVTSRVLSKADEALAAENFAEAESLYTAMPASSGATVGIVRAQLGQAKLREALALALKESAANPNDALLLDALGEVRFRRGEVQEAALALNRSAALDLCAARTHYDIAMYLRLEGRYKTAQASLDQAHRLAPSDPLIGRAWTQAHRLPQTTEQQVARLRLEASNADATAARKAELEEEIKSLQTRGKGDCELVSHSDSAKISMMPIGNVYTNAGNQGVGLDVSLNDHRRRLNVESLTKTFGVGDAGMRKTIETHVDSIRIGSMEFHNCMVRVVEDRDVMPGQDGLIGADVFRNFVVSMDFPGMEVKLSPLPKRPDEAGQTATLGTNGEDHVASADGPHDPYVAPEMKNWTPIFRSGHMLIVPTKIGNVPDKLFLVDSGAGVSSISPQAAREVTGVTVNDGAKIRGVSGEVKSVMLTGAMAIQFANVRQQATGLVSFDNSGLSQMMGVEISGMIGFNILRQVTLEIDYRDDLIHVSYTPHASIR
jgi:Flp pilus assembly protein TadD